jgi:ABC-type Fe3+ transport system permease subunit
MINSELLVLCLVVWAGSRMFRQADTMKYSIGPKKWIPQSQDRLNSVKIGVTLQIGLCGATHVAPIFVSGGSLGVPATPRKPGR